MLNAKEAYEKSRNKPKDTRYVLKYIDKQIKNACNQGKLYVILNNKITRGHFFRKTQYYYISKLPKVTDTLYIKGYNLDYLAYGIKISWENKKEKGEI